MNIKESLKKYRKSLEEITTHFAVDYNSIYNNQKEWLSNLEDKIHLLKNKDKELAIKRVIQKLKAIIDFDKNDTEDISIFISNINTIVLIANRINNFKEGTLLTNGSRLELYTLFNSIKKSDNLENLKVSLNQNLNSYLPHLFSVIKHSQNPQLYPIYYKFWKNILREVFDLNDNYDNFCEFYRTMPQDNRHLVFGSYLGTIGLQIGKNIKNDFPQLQLYSKEYKYLIDDVINIEPYSSTLNESLSIQNKINTINCNYWIFQGSPKIYNTIAALNANAVKTWTVSAHKDKIKPGDKFILWLTGANAGCYALGRIDSEVTMMKEEDAEMSYYINPTPQIDNTRVKIVIEHNLTENPVLWDMIKEDEVFKDFKGGSQGTNFTATKAQYDAILGFVNSNSSNAYAAVKKVLDQEKLQSFLSLLRNFLKSHNIQPNDDRISFNVWENHNRLVFLIGRRYALNIQKKKSQTKFSFITKEILTDKNGAFNNQKGEIEAYWNSTDTIEDYTAAIEEGFSIELGRNAKCPYRKYTNQDFINDVYQIKQSTMEDSKTTVGNPINQILYGPPGTGKTYTLKNDYFSKYTLTENSISPEVYFEEVVGTLTWWQVIALSLLEIGTNKVNEILENRWVAKKAQMSESKNVRATIWGTLQMHTIVDSKTVNYTQRQTPFIFDKTADKKWQLFENELKEQAPEIYEIMDSVTNFKPNPNKEIKHYVFTTFHQSFSYEDFIEGIKPVMEEGQENVTYKIENGIFKELCLKAQNDPNNRYAIFIDEINRGNVSQIFGELITLIETDKRIGAEHELRVKLPYSKKEFGVPMNIDIYGTMNTADRSVEALDTALRRRFSFKELLPDSKVVDVKGFTDYPRKEIMEKLNTRIELLLDRDHTLGHAYFIKKDFKHSFENEIIPLLQEYFYNDYGKIGLVLGNGFVRVKASSAKNDKSVFAEFETKNEVDITKSYELIPFEEIDFDNAIQTLLV